MLKKFLLTTVLAAAVLLPGAQQSVEAHAGWHYQHRCVMGYVQQRNLFGTLNHYWTYISHWYTLDGMYCGG